MIKVIGGIIKLNRIQKDYSLKALSKEIGLSNGYLSRVERNNELITQENAQKIFSFLNIPICTEDIDEKFEKDFLRFYKDIVFTEDFEKSYQIILSYGEQIRSTPSYVKFLLAKMVYNASTNCKESPKKYEYIQEYFSYLEEYQKQIYFDYMGTFSRLSLKIRQALDYYEEGLQYKGIDYSKAMIYYHMSTDLSRIGEYQDALIVCCASRDIFAKTVNVKRMAAISFQIAAIYSMNRHYHEAEELFLNCIKAFEALGMKGQLKAVYNDLLWHFIRSEEYTKIIQLEKTALSVTEYDHRIYFYLSYAYHKLKNNIKAIECIKNAKQRMQNPTNYMKNMIHAFSIYLSKADNQRKEKQLLNVHEKAIYTEDIDLIIFTEKLLRDFYKETQNKDKYYLSVEKLLESYEK